MSLFENTVHSSLLVCTYVTTIKNYFINYQDLYFFLFRSFTVQENILMSYSRIFED
jgi:hypothetical protein